MKVISGLVLLLLVSVVCVLAFGWVMNLVKLTRCDSEAPYKCEVVHALGVFPPVGVVTGWMDMGK